MSATTHIQSRGSGRRTVSLAAALAASFLAIGSNSSPIQVDLDGWVPTKADLAPSVQAAFPRESYSPGSTASLNLYSKAKSLTVQVFHAGPEHARTVGYDEMQGIPVTRPARIGASGGRLTVRVEVGDWPTGLYFARLHASDGRVGFAPFVVRPRRLGEHRVAVVLPTQTWQAYNFRDDNGDGTPDTWYAGWKTHEARLGRPFLNRGVPPHFRQYDLPFLNWLGWSGRQADFLADADLRSAPSAKALASAYDLIVFPGHHEYVTTREYDVVEGYRDLGGNLAFLSANNFFWQIVKRGDVMTRTKEWRDLGRSEAGLLGVQYRANDRGQHRGPWIVRDAEATPWLFAGTGLKNGSTFGSGGIEIDKTAPASPRGVKVLAEIPDLYGPGFTAQMTYYETPTGAKVFAAGAFTLAGAVLNDPVIGKLVANLWDHLSGDGGRQTAGARMDQLAR
jgi:hypothetical protein